MIDFFKSDFTSLAIIGLHDRARMYDACNTGCYRLASS